MKKCILFVLAAAAFSCSKPETSAVDSSVDSVSGSNGISDSADVWVSKNQAFLDKFRTIEIDSSLFAPPTYDEKQIGPSLTEAELKLLPEEFHEKSYIGTLQDFQAYTKFDVNPNTLGLVLRTPGEYAFTSLTLFFYDKNSDQVLPKFFQLANETGDAGYSEKLTSWLIKDGNMVKSFSHHWTQVEKIEPQDPTRESRTDDYYLIQLNPDKIDTTRVSPVDLVKYQHLLDKK